MTTLYRLAGEPEVTEKATFTDLRAGAYYADAVAWAQDLGIAKGMTETQFAPEKTVSREQTATFLYRYVTNYLKQEPGQGADLKAFADGGKVQDYAKTAMSWAVAEGFFEGYGDGTLRPGAVLTRAQMAKLPHHPGPGVLTLPSQFHASPFCWEVPCGLPQGIFHMDGNSP